MRAITLELRDEGTFIALLAVDMNPSDFLDHWGLKGSRDNPEDLRERQRWLLRRVGYPCDDRPNVLITKLAADGSPASNDPFFWGGRTMPVAHEYIIKNWPNLRDGDVVDVQFILGETKEPKVTERLK